jgi:hypothetical protein
VRPGDNRDVGDQTQEPAIHYRDKAGEIARAAGLSRSAGVRLELLQIATAFKRMAEHFERGKPPDEVDQGNLATYATMSQTRRKVGGHP